MPTKISKRSRALALRLRSLKMMTPHANEIITELRRTRDTTEIIDEESFNDVRYAKSPMHMNMEIKGIAQFHRNGVVFARVGYHMTAHMTVMMSIW